jgi:hypothetical protein
MEGSCSTGQNPPWAVMPAEEEEEDLPGCTIHVDTSVYYNCLPEDQSSGSKQVRTCKRYREN